MMATTYTYDFTFESYRSDVVNGVPDTIKHISIEVRVLYTYTPATPDVWYLRNGDPGYPGDPAEIEIIGIQEEYTPSPHNYGGAWTRWMPLHDKDLYDLIEAHCEGIQDKLGEHAAEADESEREAAAEATHETRRDLAREFGE